MLGVHLNRLSDIGGEFTQRHTPCGMLPTPVRSWDWKKDLTSRANPPYPVSGCTGTPFHDYGWPTWRKHHYISSETPNGYRGTWRGPWHWHLWGGIMNGGSIDPTNRSNHFHYLTRPTNKSHTADATYPAHVLSRDLLPNYLFACQELFLSP